MHFTYSCIQNGAGIACSDYVTGGQSWVRIPARTTDFSLFQDIQTCSEAHPADYSAGTRALPRVIKRTEREFESSPSPIAQFNPLHPELNPICYLLALLGAHHIFHVSGLRIKNEWSHDYFPHTLSWRVRYIY